MALGTLASSGPQHGHQIRRTAEVTNVGEWGGVSVGALYRELKLMAAEGLVTEVRTEQVGRRPARTIYSITGRGRMELGMLRERAIKNFHPAPDPLGVALTFSGTGDDPDELASWLEARTDFLRIAIRQVAAERQRLTARGYIDALQATIMRKGELEMQAELDWHAELAQTLAAIRSGEQPERRPGQPLDETAQPPSGLPAAASSSPDSDSGSDSTSGPGSDSDSG
jgi:DNA-binding PadR family transcriptional regulator